jgi:hypothetical protein
MKTVHSAHRTSALVLVMALVVSLGVNSSQAATITPLSEKNINQVKSVRIGSQVSLTLHSMYWSMAKLTKSSSLTSKGAPVLKPILPGTHAPHGCGIPGSGCGTQTWNFIASKVGSTHLIATRISCGEALRCTGTNGRFEVTVKVSR